MKKVQDSNDTSESNGGLMRIAPLAYFISFAGDCKKLEALIDCKNLLISR